MPTSAEHAARLRHAPPPASFCARRRDALPEARRPAAPRPGQAGFTLLEIMVTVAFVGLCILPLLKVREQSNSRAYRAARSLAAMNHAEQLLVDCMATVEEYDQYEAPVEEDPLFRYVLTLEEFDLSTGLTRDEAEQEQASGGSSFTDFGSATPGDAGVPPDEEDEDRDDFHQVRRFRIRVLWPRWDGELEDDESWDHIDLEGYLPRVWERAQEPDDG